MISNLTVVGINKGKTKAGKDFSKLYFDVTDNVKSDKKRGHLYSEFFIFEDVPVDVVGAELLCSVDIFGRITDIELN